MCNGMSFRRFCGEWRLWIRPLLILSYGIFAIIVVPLLIVNSVKDGFKRIDQLVLIGGLFVFAALPISLWHIVQHVIHFTKPILQRHIIRILWMVPIYALNAWIGLFFPLMSIYVDSLRECYEAYVIYNFMIYLLNYLNLGMDLEATMEYKPQVHHFFPLCCLRPWNMGREFIHNCKHGILQYTVVRPITTFISVICEFSGVYGEGTFAGNVAFPYIIVVNNISQFVAMYCLVLFYRANKDDLKPMKPIPKFLCIKAVVFFSFFQGVLLNVLVYFGIIQNIFGSVGGDDSRLAETLQNFLICIEMFIAAIAHIYSFPHYPFHINSPQYWNNANRSWCRAFLSVMDVSDMQEDVSEHLGVLTGSISRRFQGRGTYQPVSRGIGQNESEYLIHKRSSEASNSPTSTMAGGSNMSGKRENSILKNDNKYYQKRTTNNDNKQANVNRYGATDNRYVVPVYENHIFENHPIQSHIIVHSQPNPKTHSNTHNIEYPSTSKNIAHTQQKSKYYSLGISDKDVQQQEQQQQQQQQQLHVPSNTASSGISIQRQDLGENFAPHYGAPLAENNFLQGRGLVEVEDENDDEDLATLLGNNTR